jgi:hypothetical protein
MLLLKHLCSIAFLGSVTLFAAAWNTSTASDIPLGLVQFETVTVAANGGTHLPYIVVRVTNQTNRIESFGLSNEAGVLEMPVPPGRYCYEAFSQAGHHLVMNRPKAERCFSVKKEQTVEVGVGLKPQ